MCATNGGGIVNFAGSKMLTGDRPTFCGNLIAFFLALFAVVPLYGQSGLTSPSHKRFLKRNWPEHQLYDAMFNTERGDSYVAEMLAHCVQQLASHEQISVIPNSR
jgi:hypothetical protein